MASIQRIPLDFDDVELGAANVCECPDCGGNATWFRRERYEDGLLNTSKVFNCPHCDRRAGRSLVALVAAQ